MTHPITISQDVLERFNMDHDTFINYLQNLSKNTLMETLEMNYIDISTDRLVMSMPIGPKNHQPMGILHGGASVSLAETVASIASFLNIDSTKKVCVGLEINANHIRSKKEGILIAIATPLHRGRTTMIWDIKLMDEDERLICVSRCTMAIIDRPS